MIVFLQVPCWEESKLEGFKELDLKKLIKEDNPLQKYQFLPLKHS
jgi:hypothetical protein